MRDRLILLVPFCAVLAGCASASAPPSLLPRAAEKIDPRVPVEGAVNDRPVDAALASQLRTLVAQARAGDAAFGPAAAEADRLAGAAGAPQSESWTVAQQALSAATAARAPTTRALGDIDALAAEALQRQGGLAPSDQAALTSAAETVAAIDREQSAILDRLQRRLGN